MLSKKGQIEGRTVAIIIAFIVFVLVAGLIIKFDLPQLVRDILPDFGVVDNGDGVGDGGADGAVDGVQQGDECIKDAYWANYYVRKISSSQTINLDGYILGHLDDPSHLKRESNELTIVFEILDVEKCNHVLVVKKGTVKGEEIISLNENSLQRLPNNDGFYIKHYVVFPSEEIEEYSFVILKGKNQESVFKGDSIFVKKTS